MNPDTRGGATTLHTSLVVQQPLPQVVVVDAMDVGTLYADALRTHRAAGRVDVVGPNDELSRACTHADLAICTPGAGAEKLFACVTAVRAVDALLPLLFLAPADVPDVVAAALEAGASDVLSKTPGYIEQLPTAVRKNVLLAHRADTHAGQVRMLAHTVEEIRQDNATLQMLVEKLQAVAMTDSLTHLANRRAIEQRLDELAATSGRYGQDLSILMVDLDGLKLVNDLLGHQAGDELIRLAAKALCSQFRKGDVVGRLGGDEFVVILPHTRVERATRVAERLQAGFVTQADGLQKRLDDARRAMGVVSKIGSDGRLQSSKLGMTIGVAGSMPGQRIEPRTLLLQADKAMYVGKREERGSVRVANDNIGAIRHVG